MTVDGDGVGPVPAGAAALVANTTITEPTRSNFFTVFPADVARPLASNLNYGYFIAP